MNIHQRDWIFSPKNSNQIKEIIIDLSAGYAQTKYASNKDKELVLAAGYTFVESLSSEVLYVDYEVADDDKSKVAATLTYSF